MDRAQRITIGVIAALFLGVGAVGAIADLDPAWPEFLLRGGILLTAIWFAAPAFSRLPRRVLIGLSVVALMLVIRPRLILWGIVIGVGAAVLAGRSRERT